MGWPWHDGDVFGGVGGGGDVLWVEVANIFLELSRKIPNIHTHAFTYTYIYMHTHFKK